MYYTEWACHVPIAVVNKGNGKRWWFDKLSDEDKEEALKLPGFDLNLQSSVVVTESRIKGFRMHRKQFRF